MKDLRLGWLLAVAAAALVLEMTILANVAWAGARPDLLVPVVAFAALFAADSGLALGTAWAAGLLRDFGTAGPLGQFALIYLVIAWAIHNSRPYLFREHPLTQAALGAAGAVAAALASAACTAAFAGGVPLGLVFVRTASSAFATALLAPVVVTLLSRTRLVR